MSESESSQKTFVLDTNVILHDSECVYHFDEHDIVIPITVLEELDNFKKGNQIINYHARKFTRTVDELSSDKLFNGGMEISPEHGKISVKLERAWHSDLQESLTKKDKPDNQILNLAYCLQKDDKKVIVLVTKDMNLRMKARALGLMAEDYTTDHVQFPEKLYKGSCVIDCSETIFEEFISNSLIPDDKIDSDLSLVSNQFVSLRSGRNNAFACFDQKEGVLKNFQKQSVYGIVPRNMEQTFAVQALLDPALPLVTITGKAGTGKTLLALATALETRSKYRQILMTRPVVPLSNKDIGYLPGDIQSKIKPYMQPLYDNLGVIRNQFSDNSEMYQRLQRMIDDDKLLIEPLAYIRGRSLVKMYMIVDEAQNLTPHEVKTIITRAGEGTKIIFTGDIFQIDHPYVDIHSNGLSTLIDKMQGQRLYAHMDLRKGERSELAELASDIL